MFFTGLLNDSFLLWIFLISMPTGVLICMENSFWNISRDGNFVKSFKESFTSYIGSGMRMKAEEAVTILRHEQGGSEDQATADFEARFRKLITDHYLRKIHCFYIIHSAHLTAFFI